MKDISDSWIALDEEEVVEAMEHVENEKETDEDEDIETDVDSDGDPEEMEYFMLY